MVAHFSTERLLQAAARYDQDILTFLQDLIRIPSVNGRDTEAAVAQRIAQEAERLNLPAHMVAKDPERPNAVVKWGSGRRSGFALVGHIDTVAPGNEDDWSTPPFAATVRDGQLIGRGAADNKAGIACGLYALALVRDEGLLDPQDVSLVLTGVVDEESGASSTLGVRYLIDEGHLPVKGVIYTYTSDIICVGHRGLLRLRLTAEGKSVHSGSSDWARGEQGVNAVTGLAELLLALEQLEVDTPDHPAFSHLGLTITPGTRFEGGEYESMVPARAQALVDCRLMPGQSSHSVIDAVKAQMTAVETRRPGLKFHLEVKNDLPAASIPTDHRLVQVAARHSRQLTGRPWPIAGAGPANEGYMLIQAGIPTLCGFGPTGGNAHAPDEWVAIDSLTPTVAMYAAIMGEYCGGE